MAKKSKNLICTNCGSEGTPKTVHPGSLFAEIILWIFFLLPGLIYSTWRFINIHKACKVCGSQNLVPSDSPVGKKLKKDFEQSSLIEGEEEK